MRAAHLCSASLTGSMTGKPSALIWGPISWSKATIRTSGYGPFPNVVGLLPNVKDSRIAVTEHQWRPRARQRASITTYTSLNDLECCEFEE